jgi:hypothetical protein
MGLFIMVDSLPKVTSKLLKKKFLHAVKYVNSVKDIKTSALEKVSDWTDTMEDSLVQH